MGNHGVLPYVLTRYPASSRRPNALSPPNAIRAALRLRSFIHRFGVRACSKRRGLCAEPWAGPGRNGMAAHCIDERRQQLARADRGEREEHESARVESHGSLVIERAQHLRARPCRVVHCVRAPTAPNPPMRERTRPPSASTRASPHVNRKSSQAKAYPAWLGACAGTNARRCQWDKPPSDRSGGTFVRKATQQYQGRCTSTATMPVGARASRAGRDRAH
jgi:hypothetical protein